MKVLFAGPRLPHSGILVLTVVQDQGLGAVARGVDQSTGGQLSRALEGSRFSGKREEILSVLAPAGLEVNRILLVGLGKADKLDALAYQAAGGAVVAALLKAGPAEAAVALEPGLEHTLSPADSAAHLAYGARLRRYRFAKYRTTEKEEHKPTLTQLTLLLEDAAGARSAFERLEPVAAGVQLARDLVSEPANALYPESFAERCRELAADGVGVEVLEPEFLRNLGMGALLGVAQGSARGPRVVVLRYQGAPERADARPLAFVGKGVTFDSGGISLKPAGGMEDMKWDMAGAAAVAGLFKALAGRKARVNAVGVIGLVENMPSGSAQRPGDVVTSMSGQTIEVINTDAEGRLVLADCLWYAQETFKPRLMIDLATLTGAVIVALGSRQAGLFSNHDELAQRLTEAGRAAGEPLWRLPLDDGYDKDLDSEIADMKNVASSRDAGSIMGAQFLQRFVHHTPWAHLDIAGVTWSKKDTATVPKGGTGFGVRLLDRLVAEFYEA